MKLGEELSSNNGSQADQSRLWGLGFRALGSSRVQGLGFPQEFRDMLPNSLQQTLYASSENSQYLSTFGGQGLTQANASASGILGRPHTLCAMQGYTLILLKSV